MTETATQDGSFGMKLRTRRSGAFNDISNVVSQISDAAKRVASGAKRKSMGAKANDAETESSDSSLLRANPSADAPGPKKARKSFDGAPVSQAEVKLEVKATSSSASSSLSSSSAIATRPSGLGQDPDPAKCLKDIDAMYIMYRSMEDQFSAKPYMQKQNDINYKMRAILIDWLVEIHFKFKLHASTLWLCVNILDRYLENEVILRSKLQLIGVTALFIACKFEEVFPPLVKDCIYITDCAYDQQELLKMETKILTTLNYEILVPTGYHFLSRYLQVIKASERTRLLASYYAERNLQESECVKSKPHVYAAAAVFAALQQQNTQYSVGKSAWPLCLEEESGLKEADVAELACAIVQHVSEEPETTSKRKLIAAKRKYTLSKFNKVAELVLPKFV